jgi:hypothetical protein
MPPGVTKAMLAADPDLVRPEWVVPGKFWDDLKKVLAANQATGPGDTAMADQARALIALHDTAQRGRRSSIALPWKRIYRSATAGSTIRWVSTLATAGSVRRMAALG